MRRGVVARVLAERLTWIRLWYSRILSAVARVLGVARTATATEVTIIPVLAQSLNYPYQYQELLWTAEQVDSRAVLIDLTQARTLKASFFEVLATGWNGQRVEKLGVRVTFEQWARLYQSIKVHQHRLKEKGVMLMLFYEAQDYLAWYREDRVVHDAELVIQGLCSSSELSIRWPTLLDAATSLLDEYGPHRRADALVKLSQLALDCGVEVKALALANEALLYEMVLPPDLECQARRIRGEAFLQLGQYDDGVQCLEDAVEVGSRAGVWEEAACAAYALGIAANDCEDHPLAEKYQRLALRLSPREPSEFRGRIHAALAIALFRQGKNPEAEQHNEISSDMRRVSAHSSQTDRARLRTMFSYMRSSHELHAGG